MSGQFSMLEYAIKMRSGGKQAQARRFVHRPQQPEATADCVNERYVQRNTYTRIRLSGYIRHAKHDDCSKRNRGCAVL